MGANLSTVVDGWKKVPAKQPKKVLLVPPMFERDLRMRSRFAKSSFKYLFARPSMKWLMADYLEVTGPKAVLHFTPPADPSFTVKAKLSLDASSMALRYQPLGPQQPSTFIDFKADQQSLRNSQLVAIRACYLDLASGFGAYLVAPLDLYRPRASLGLRYSSPWLTCGAQALVASPGVREKLAGGRGNVAWLAGRYEGITAGIQIDPSGLPLSAASSSGNPPGSTPGSNHGSNHGSTSEGLPFAEWLRDSTIVAVSYSPPGGISRGGGPAAAATRNSFTASLELQRGRTLAASFHQHFALVRRVVNPMEGADVIGITNYIDLGIQLFTPVGQPESTSAPAGPQQPHGLNLGAAWQVNKNWLLKARVGSSSASASVGIRGWVHPSFILLGSVSYNYGGAGVGGASKIAAPFSSLGGLQGLRWGLMLQLENYGNVTYERGSQEARGRALLQRHEATDQDVANFAGLGRVVKEDAAEASYNPEGRDATAAFM